MTAVLVGLAALSLAACSDDDTSDTAVSTTSTVSEPQTSTPADSTTTTVGDVLGDGEHVGYITEFQESDDPRGSYIVDFDLAYLLTGQEATDAATKAGVELDTDHYIQNDNPRQRSVTLAPDVVTTIVGEGEDCCESVEISVGEFSSWIYPTLDHSTDVRSGPLVRLTIEDGLVTRIDEVYLG